MMKKKIAFMIPSLHGGGAERVVSRLSLALFEEFDISIIYFYKTNIIYPINGKIIFLDFNHIKNKNKSKVIRVFSYLKEIKKVKSVNNFDVVISFLHYPNFYNVLTRVKGQKTITSVRNYFFKSYSLVNRILFFFVLILSDNLVVQTEEIKRKIRNVYKFKCRNVSVIENIIGLDEIVKKSNEPLDSIYESLFANNQVLINVGRLEPQKNHKRLLKIFANYMSNNVTNNQLKLVIIGQGTLKEKLEVESEKLGISRNVLFMGFQQNPFKYIKRSNCFLFTSNFEGYPNAILESIACQTPVITVNCPTGPQEIYDKVKFGSLIKIGDEDKIISCFSKEINKILEDKNKSVTLQNNMSEYLNKKNDLNIINKWIDLIL